jgi:hypothetical protein
MVTQSLYIVKKLLRHADAVISLQKGPSNHCCEWETFPHMATCILSPLKGGLLTALKTLF